MLSWTRIIVVGAGGCAALVTFLLRRPAQGLEAKHPELRIRPSRETSIFAAAGLSMSSLYYASQHWRTAAVGAGFSVLGAALQQTQRRFSQAILTGAGMYTLTSEPLSSICWCLAAACFVTPAVVDVTVNVSRRRAETVPLIRRELKRRSEQLRSSGPLVEQRVRLQIDRVWERHRLGQTASVHEIVVAVGAKELLGCVFEVVLDVELPASFRAVLNQLILTQLESRGMQQCVENTLGSLGSTRLSKDEVVERVQRTLVPLVVDKGCDIVEKLGDQPQIIFDTIDSNVDSIMLWIHKGVETLGIAQ